MVGDEVRDAVTGQVYVVTWDGRRRESASLLGDDDYRYRRQRPDIKDRLTSEAIGPLGFRPGQVKCDIPVDWPW